MTGRDDWAPEAGCNCEHLADEATCVACALKRPGDNPDLLFGGRSDPDDDLEVLTDGGADVRLETPEHTLDDEMIVEDLIMSCELAEERGTDAVQILAALDAVANTVNEDAEIPDWLILRERFGVDIRDAGADTLEELVDEASSDYHALDPRGWF
jgi:hypothetical protein